jgi:ribosomal protein S18 acetylase RimI-like enzyme
MPGARRHGVGAALIGFAIERAKSLGCRQISIDTNERNAEALALYEKLGFSAVATR